MRKLSSHFFVCLSVCRRSSQLFSHSFDETVQKKKKSQILNEMSEDCWDAFGSDDSDAEEEEEVTRDEAAIALFLSQYFLKENAQVKLSDRVVGLLGSQDTIRLCLQQRGMKVLTSNLNDYFLDALIIIQTDEPTLPHMKKLLPGGLLVTPKDYNKVGPQFLPLVSIEQTPYVSRIKKAILPHTSTCPWLPSSFSVEQEQKRLLEATISLSSYEVENKVLTESSLLRAVQSISLHGYVVIRNLLDAKECKKWGEAILETVHLASKILMEREEVNILNPQQSKNEPQTYRELSMREDLRLDLRHGPQLSELRCANDNSKGDSPVVLSASADCADCGFLRGNKNILEIIRRAMNPKSKSLYKGNIGRYNFDGSGPDGSYQDLRVSQVGGIVSFPGAADQAM